MIDNKDQKIIEILKTSGREPASSISEKIGISVPTAIDRIKKLQEAGVIKGYKAIIDTKKIGLDVSAMIIIISESYSSSFFFILFDDFLLPYLRIFGGFTALSFFFGISSVFCELIEGETLVASSLIRFLFGVSDSSFIPFFNCHLSDFF